MDISMRVAPIADKARKCNSLFDTDGEDGMGRKEKKKKKESSGLGCWIRTREPSSYSLRDPIYQVPAQNEGRIRFQRS